jgi:hypothetical protein
VSCETLLLTYYRCWSVPGHTRLVAAQAWHTRSGHVLVQPRINGAEAGYMILDTGASGFVIERAAADKLGLLAFGELYVSGMAGKVDPRPFNFHSCHFTRYFASTIQVGTAVSFVAVPSILAAATNFFFPPLCRSVASFDVPKRSKSGRW